MGPGVAGSGSSGYVDEVQQPPPGDHLVFVALSLGTALPAGLFGLFLFLLAPFVIHATAWQEGQVLTTSWTAWAAVFPAVRAEPGAFLDEAELRAFGSWNFPMQRQWLMVVWQREQTLVHAAVFEAAMPFQFALMERTPMGRPFTS
jgi:hypothetical protein